MKESDSNKALPDGYVAWIDARYVSIIRSTWCELWRRGLWGGDTSACNAVHRDAGTDAGIGREKAGIGMGQTSMFLDLATQPEIGVFGEKLYFPQQICTFPCVSFP